MVVEYILLGSGLVLAAGVVMAFLTKRAKNKEVEALRAQLEAVQDELRNTHSSHSVKVLKKEQRDVG